MPASLIDQGLNLMLYGMGTVFVFLTLMVFATTLMSALVEKIVPSNEEQEASSQPSPQVRRAIEQAIKLHLKK